MSFRFPPTVYECSARTSNISSLSKSFAPIHPPGTLDSLPPEAYIGSIDPATVPRSSHEPTEEEKQIEKARAALPSPSAVLNLREIEVWSFDAIYSSSLRANQIPGTSRDGIKCYCLGVLSLSRGR